jgi:hypothetical protein
MGLVENIIKAHVEMIRPFIATNVKIAMYIASEYLKLFTDFFEKIVPKEKVEKKE